MLNRSTLESAVRAILMLVVGAFGFHLSQEHFETIVVILVALIPLVVSLWWSKRSDNVLVKKVENEKLDPPTNG